MGLLPPLAACPLSVDRALVWQGADLSIFPGSVFDARTLKFALVWLLALSV